MRVLITGSRDWTDVYTITERLVRLPSNCEVLHGGAKGADRIAGGIARDLGHDVRVFPADWGRHGNAAGPIRNVQMADEKPDLVLAFHQNNSRGTRHMIGVAKARGIPIEVFTCSDEKQEGMV